MTKSDEVLDRILLNLSKSDPLRVRDAVEGIAILGAPGSGKTTTSGRQVALALLQIPNSSGLVLTAKPDETTNWIAYAKECGREKDLIVFNAESGLHFDPLHYAFNRPGRGAGDTETVIDFFLR
jgi:Mg-chelatase subunit ChlI